MATPFEGTINTDIRDSEPDWSPFEPPKAPEGAPNVVYIVLDDVGFSAMSCYGGPIETQNIDRIVNDGVRYTQFHTTGLCSPTRSCLLTGRNHTRNSMACITEAAVGFPNASGTIPPENGMLAELLGELGWNTFDLGEPPTSRFWKKRRPRHGASSTSACTTECERAYVILNGSAGLVAPEGRRGRRRTGGSRYRAIRPALAARPVVQRTTDSTTSTTSSA